jgi:hypothetical protein
MLKVQGSEKKFKNNKNSPHPWTGTRACSRYHPDYESKLSSLKLLNAENGRD